MNFGFTHSGEVVSGQWSVVSGGSGTEIGGVVGGQWSVVSEGIGESDRLRSSNLNIAYTRTPTDHGPLATDHFPPFPH